MAEAAEQLLAGTGWLPGPLRTQGGASQGPRPAEQAGVANGGLDRALPEGAVNTEADADAPSGSEALPAFLADVGEQEDVAPAGEIELDPALAAHAIAAE